MPTPRTDRRDFLKSASIFGGAAAAPYFFSTPRAFADEMKSANDRPNIGVVGCGGIAAANMTAAKNYVNVVALADVDSKRLRSFNKKLAGGKAATFGDYRDVIHRDDV
ncbi:MAG: gfo/Idh/MocA family oxidoreductase, partial [Planctomycetota bacterium]